MSHRTGQYVRHVPPPNGTPPCRHDEWRGGTFVEADGTELEVVWSGASRVPLCAEIARRHDGTLPALRGKTLARSAYR